jgi:rhodanese-related sulfurtransferase
MARFPKPSIAVLATALALPAAAQTIFQATLGETAFPPEVSTTELLTILSTRSAVVLDARPNLEWSISHIPDALNVAAKPGVLPSEYVSDVAEVARLVAFDRSAPLVLYCNGPFCGKSKRLGVDLRDDGFTNVRRYQLGIPTWRALGGMTQIEPAGLAYVFWNDHTAVWIDVREPADFERGTLRHANVVNIPRSLVLEGKDVGEIKKAKDDGRLPTNDHDTRIVVFGATEADARFVAAQVAKEAFHNTSFFAGTLAQIRDAVRPDRDEDDRDR